MEEQRQSGEYMKQLESEVKLLRSKFAEVANRMLCVDLENQELRRKVRRLEEEAKFKLNSEAQWEKKSD